MAEVITARKIAPTVEEEDESLFLYDGMSTV
jgi:hypothetical protein